MSWWGPHAILIWWWDRYPGQANAPRRLRQSPSAISSPRMLTGPERQFGDEPCPDRHSQTASHVTVSFAEHAGTAGKYWRRAAARHAAGSRPGDRTRARGQRARRKLRPPAAGRASRPVMSGTVASAAAVEGLPRRLVDRGTRRGVQQRRGGRPQSVGRAAGGHAGAGAAANRPRKRAETGPRRRTVAAAAKGGCYVACGHARRRRDRA